MKTTDLQRVAALGPVCCGPIVRRGGRALAAGFSLVEVLIAMGIFAVGFVAVAAMFPAGAILQRETVADVESQLVARNAAALMRTRRITFQAKSFGLVDSTKVDLGNDSGSGKLEPFTNATNVSAKLKTSWQKLGDRGYPTAQQSTTDRKYYWVPFLRRTKGTANGKGDWVIVVFVMRRDAGSTYDFATPPVPSGTWGNKSPNAFDDGPTVPKVIGVNATVSANKFVFPNRLFTQTPVGQPDQVRAGDFIADNNGVVYNVIDADSTGCSVAGGIATTTSGTPVVWYAPPASAGQSSPCVRILLIVGAVEQIP